MGNLVDGTEQAATALGNVAERVEPKTTPIATRSAGSRTKKATAGRSRASRPGNADSAPTSAERAAAAAAESAAAYEKYVRGAVRAEPTSAERAAAAAAESAAAYEKYVRTEAPAEDGAMSREAWALQRAMHRLWADQALWTRNYVVAALAGAPDTEAAADRLLRNQEDVGNAIARFYGEEAGDGLTLSLKQHIVIAVDLIELVRLDDFGERFEELDRKWDENAAQIARLLGDLNPHWGKRDVYDLLSQHLALTRQWVDARVFDDWEKDIAIFDHIMSDIITLADALSVGIIKQFPERI